VAGPFTPIAKKTKGWNLKNRPKEEKNHLSISKKQMDRIDSRNLKITIFMNEKQMDI